MPFGRLLGVRRLLALLERDRCEHEWVPERYGYVTGVDELLACIEVCLRCGARIARCP